MLEVGNIKPGRDIGRNGKSVRYRKYIWWECPQCENRYWRRHPVESDLCKSCSAKIASMKNWQSTRILDHYQYILVRIPPDDPYIKMGKAQKARGYGKYILEHRLIMAKHLGRCLTQSEIVHHLNGVKTDNRIENLAIVNTHNHERNTLLSLLQKRIRELEQLHLDI